MLRFAMNSVKKGSIGQFFIRYKERLEELQEAQFDKGERELQELIDDNNVANYPLPTFTLSILVWAFVLLFPVVLIFDPKSATAENFQIWKIADYYVPMLSTMVIFFVNLRILVPKCFLRKKYLRFFAINAWLLVFVVMCRDYVSFLMHKSSNATVVNFFSDYFLWWRSDFDVWSFVGFFIVLLLVCFICILINIVIRQLIRAFILREKRRTEIVYELNFLKRQLSPHFLFNTLNNITSLIRLDPTLAEKSMTKLSQLLRTMLYQTEDQFITIKEDIEILEEFAALEKLRLDSNFDFSFDVKLENPQIKIEPLLVMPLMENSMKHCVNPNGKSFAHIKIEQNGNDLHFRSENSNFPRKSKNKYNGLGLATFKKRLELMYSGRYIYESKIENDTYISDLHITLNKITT